MTRFPPALAAYLLLIANVLVACGDEGNNDSLLTGISGFVILLLILWFVSRRAKNR